MVGAEGAARGPEGRRSDLAGGGGARENARGTGGPQRRQKQTLLSLVWNIYKNNRMDMVYFYANMGPSRFMVSYRWRLIPVGVGPATAPWGSDSPPREASGGGGRDDGGP